MCIRDRICSDSHVSLAGFHVFTYVLGSLSFKDQVHNDLIVEVLRYAYSYIVVIRKGIHSSAVKNVILYKTIYIGLSLIHILLAAATYDGGVFPCMEDFLHHLKAKNYQKRTVAYIQNGSWGPAAGKAMKDIVAGMKNITEIEPMVTIKSSMKEADIAKLEALADALLAQN